MYKHDFLAKCPKGHKRNFIWHEETKDKLTTVTSNCVRCGEHTIEKEVEFTVERYWESPEKLP